MSTLGPDPSNLKQIAYATWWLCLATARSDPGVPQIMRTPIRWFHGASDTPLSERKGRLETAETSLPAPAPPVPPLQDPRLAVTPPVPGRRAQLTAGTQETGRRVRLCCKSIHPGQTHTARLLPSPVRNRNCHSHFTDKKMWRLTEGDWPKGPQLKSGRMGT